jgi:hypothetical protein
MESFDSLRASVDAGKVQADDLIENARQQCEQLEQGRVLAMSSYLGGSSVIQEQLARLTVPLNRALAEAEDLQRKVDSALTQRRRDSGVGKSVATDLEDSYFITPVKMPGLKTPAKFR